MGKDLKGRLLDKGITQEKSEYYVARYVDRFGKRQSKRFKKYQEARQWLADSKHLDESSNMLYPQTMTVDAWFNVWITLKKTSVRLGTIETYTSYYNNSIKNEIGDMKLIDVKPMHCQRILTNMGEKGYHQGTIKHVRIVLYGMFEDAKENDIIGSNPIKRSLKIEVGKPAKVKEALTIDEQTKLFEQLVGHKYENQYILALQTGLRVGELVGLKWDDIDFKNRTLKVERTMKYVYATKEWRIGSPKSYSGNRLIPLTDVAIKVLKRQKEKNNNLDVFPIEYKDYVFINENGIINYNSYDSALSYLCKKIGIKHITMHNLRHSFATRCISAGMKPKTLQTILGHASIDVTMDLYVHTSEEDKFKELDKVSKLLNVI